MRSHLEDVFGGKRNKAGGRASLGDESARCEETACGGSPTAASTTSLAPCLYTLNTGVRKRLEKFEETCQFCVVAAQHNVDQCPVHSMERKLKTIVAQARLTCFPELDVWRIGLGGFRSQKRPLILDVV